MENDSNLDPKFMGEISSDFLKVADDIQEAAYQIKKRGFSNYPIFPMSKLNQKIPYGSLLYEANQMGNKWNYYASYMELFLEMKVIQNKENFIQVYKPLDEFACLFVITESFKNIVFIPYPEN